MQEAIWQIGKLVYNEDDFVANLYQKLERLNSKGQPMHVVKLNFDLLNKRLEIDTNEEVDESTAEKYCFVGHADSSNAPQWNTVVKVINYLLSQTITNLIDMDIDVALKHQLIKVRDTFFVDIGELRGKERYRYLLDLSLVGLSSLSPRDFFVQAKGDIKETIKTMGKAFISSISDKYGVSEKEIALYVIAIDGVVISQLETYKNLIYKEKTKVFEKGENGICSICAASHLLTADTSKLELKFYTTTNLNFPSHFDKKNYKKNMLLCNECMSTLITGEKFIMQNLMSRIGSFTVYILPSFLFLPKIDRQDMEEIVRHVKNTFHLTVDLSKIQGMEGEIRSILNDQCLQDYYLINLIFYRKGQKDVKVQRLIKDVHPTRFAEVDKAIEQVRNSANHLFGASPMWRIDLKSIYYLTPMRVSKNGDLREYRKLLSVYDAIFKQLPLKKEIILEQLAQLLKVYYFEQFNRYNIGKEHAFKGSLSNVVLRGNLFLRLLELVGCIKGGEVMNFDTLELTEDIKKYLSEMKYSEEEVALFLLGFLVGEVGNRQSRLREGKKPILNKVNFNGMDKARIERLSNEIPKKLREINILKYNERIYSLHKCLLDRHFGHWKMNKQKALFYLMSGYAYATERPKILKQKGGNIDEQL